VFTVSYYSPDALTIINSNPQVPVNDKNKMLQSLIKYNDAWAEFIHEPSLIIWDEATIVNQMVLACVENTCRLVMDSDEPFSGKVVYNVYKLISLFVMEQEHRLLMP
jgi:hypothetical protein